MKIFYTFIFAIVSLASAQAQLTQANHAPANGDMFEMYQCDSVGPGGSGAGTTWNFAIATHSSILMSYTANSVNSPSYPQANIGVAATANNTGYYGSSASSLLYYGGNIKVGPVSAALNYSAPAIYASYPMSMGTTSNSAIGGTINVSTPIMANGTFAGTSTVTADATGTLSIAGSTYTNVTRLLVKQVISFTTNVANGNLDQNLYQYYQSGIKAPIMTIETATVTIPFFGSPTQTIVQRMKATAPTNTTVIDVGLSSHDAVNGIVRVFPNPANNELTVFYPTNTAITLSVFDVTGKLIENKTFDGVWAKLDVSQYNKGMYIYRINGASDEVLAAGRFTVVH